MSEVIVNYIGKGRRWKNHHDGERGLRPCDAE